MKKNRSIFERGKPVVRIGYTERNICVTRGRCAESNAASFNLFISTTYARSIDQLHSEAIQIDKCFDIIARGAGNFADNSPLEIQQRIKYAALPDIRWASERDSKVCGILPPVGAIL